MSNTVEAIKPAVNNLRKQAKVNIHKFGGSSLATDECIKRVVGIIKSHCQLDDMIVVSANGDTTDALFQLLDLACQHHHLAKNEANSQQLSTLAQDINSALSALENMQMQLINALLNASSADRLGKALAQDINTIKQQLLVDIIAFKNDLLAYGEYWSVRLLVAILNEQVCPSYGLDAREFLLLANEKQLTIDYAQSRLTLESLKQSGKLAVVTGYIAQNNQQQTCTLGRNGSDYSATIMAALSQAQNVTLWTDVDGIYSADPRVVPLARKLYRLPNGVAKELGRLGNPVLHAKTLQPLAEHNSHLNVASSFAPEITPTKIGQFGQIAKQELSVTHLNDLVLIRAEALKNNNYNARIEELNPISYQQSTGELLITAEQRNDVEQLLASLPNIAYQAAAMIAVVGHHVAQRGDVRARFKRALNHQPVLAYHKAKNAHSYIAILPEQCDIELLNTVHSEMSKDARNIGLVIAGLGNIGQAFLTMLPKQIAKQSALENLHLVALLGREKAYFNSDGISVSDAMETYQQYASPYQPAQLLTWLDKHPYDELVVVDMTPSEAFSLLYADFFARGIHVIAANKWASSCENSQYQALVASQIEHNSLWLGNSTVGAGLPINNTIAQLIESGDEIREISGVFSGTLSWLFQHYNGETPFSELIKNALQQGITEPDPREDLSGRDVQRKLLILARIAGFTLSLEDIECENLVPESLQQLSVTEFLQQAHQLDEVFSQRYQQAVAQQCGIRYVAKLTYQQGKLKAKVSLERLPLTAPFCQLLPCDNIFQIKSAWYQDNPLIIRGPGAGREVTAGGVHADLMVACQQLNHRHPQVHIKGLY